MACALVALSGGGIALLGSDGMPPHWRPVEAGRWGGGPLLRKSSSPQPARGSGGNCLRNQWLTNRLADPIAPKLNITNREAAGSVLSRFILERFLQVPYMMSSARSCNGFRSAQRN